ncbi:MAG: AMP-dependent synthetase [Verrucomicrobia bacterium]|nr:MAG: AMP-dependent synthetase [Verrucomicrobiota bacterium]
MPGNSAAERAFYFCALLIARTIYRVKAFGLENLPPDGCLVVPNHITWIDAIILQLACPRPVRFIIDEEFYRKPALQPVLRMVRAIPIDRRKPREAIRRATDQIEAGQIVCIFPEGQLSRTGTLARLQRGFEMIARHAQAPVVPVFLDQLWGSIFSFRGGKFFRKWPKHFPYRATVGFGAPLSAEEATIARVHEDLLKLGADCFEQRSELHDHIARRALRGLKRSPFATLVTDGMDGSKLSRGKLLGASIALSRCLRKTFPEKRIAIVLPAGKGAVVANLAVALADKVPVGLNFTASADAIASAIDRAEIKTAITAKQFRGRLPNFPWPPNIVLLDELLPKLKRQILFWWIAGMITPQSLLARWLRLPRYGGHEEAVLLFTSGSSGEPKGVVLSHHNVIGNVAQFTVMLDAEPGDSLLASLPFFHSFGCTVTLWYPLIEGTPIITYPSPLEAAKNAALVEKYKITVLLATPTFLRAYLRKAEPEQLRSARLVIVGAEKMPLDLSEKFFERFGKRVMEGYGLTETAPVVSVNLPDPIPEHPDVTVQLLYRLGSVGKMAAGIAAEIRNPETDEKLSIYDSGMLWLRGPNIFEGYLKDPKRTAEVLHNGWLKTGDIGRLDEDGFLYIEGRLSRFSKIGGEMVPHEVVEQKIITALGLEGSERRIAICGVPDEAKGEALLLLTADPIEMDKLRAALNEAGVPNLWIPKRSVVVENIPLLASGKLDITRCQELAAARPN